MSALRTSTINKTPPKICPQQNIWPIQNLLQIFSERCLDINFQGGPARRATIGWTGISTRRWKLRRSEGGRRLDSQGGSELAIGSQDTYLGGIVGVFVIREMSDISHCSLASVNIFLAKKGSRKLNLSPLYVTASCVSRWNQERHTLDRQAPLLRCHQVCEAGMTCIPPPGLSLGCQWHAWL